MKNISLFVVIDNIFKLLLFFLFNFIWCTYFIKTAWLSVFLSVLIAFLTLFITNKINQKKYKKHEGSLKLEQRMIDIRNTFIYMNNNDILSFFKKLICTKHNCEIIDDYIMVKTNEKPIYLFPYFKQSSLTPDDVLTIYKKINNKEIKRLIILTNSIGGDVSAITSNFNFETLILDYKQTYSDLLEKYEFYPEISLKTKPKAKNTFKQILNISINKKKTKGYLLSALFLVFSSMFVSFRIYYLLVASVLVFLAILSFTSPNFNKTSKANLLD